MKKILLLCLIVIISGCGTKIYNKGKIFTDDEKQAYNSAQTKQDILKGLGTPSATTLYGKDETWIYFGSVMRQSGFFQPYYEKYELNLLTFNGDNIAKKQMLTLKEKRNIAFDTDSTDIEGAIDLNPIEELFNNIGRFSAGGMGN